MKARHILTLAISHNIFLEREQRYELASGKEIEAIGVSLPVWFYKGNTSEPAQEVFCKYSLTNDKADMPISDIGHGYKINVPQTPKNYQPPVEISDDKWRKLPYEKQEEWYMNKIIPITGKNLLDSCDGGSSYIRFRQHNRVKRNNQYINIIHFVEIGTIENLIDSLV